METLAEVLRTHVGTTRCVTLEEINRPALGQAALLRSLSDPGYYDSDGGGRRRSHELDLGLGKRPASLTGGFGCLICKRTAGYHDSLRYLEGRGQRLLARGGPIVTTLLWTL